MEDRRKVVFMGTPEFAVPSLHRVAEAGFDVLAVVTQPDKPQGRGNIVIPPPVKAFALEHRIPVLQPADVSEITQTLVDMAPDFIVVVAFGHILKKDLLCVPCKVCRMIEHKACINVHASLLPAYRGASPIQWAVINGDRKSGVTTMLMDEGMDTGPILMQQEVPVSDDDTFATLHDKLAVTGAVLLTRTLENFDNIDPRPQDHTRATYTTKLSKLNGLIDWSRPATDVHNLVRGCNPWPSAYTFHNGRRLIIWRSTALPPEALEAEPGVIISADDVLGIRVSTGMGTLAINELQREGKRRQDATSFLLGFPLKRGDRFTSEGLN